MSTPANPVPSGQGPTIPAIPQAPAPNLTQPATVVPVPAAASTTTPVVQINVQTPVARLTPAVNAIIAGRAQRVIESAAQFTSMTNLIAAPPTSSITATSYEDGNIDRFTVPVLPANADATLRKRWCLRLASCFRSSIPINERDLAPALLALFAEIYPKTTRNSLASEWLEYELKDPDIAKLRTFLDEGKKLPAFEKPTAGGPKTRYERALAAFSTDQAMPHIPNPGQVTTKFFEGNLDWTMFHGFLGLLIFSMHKDVKTNQGNALMVARPLALQRKYGKTDTEYVLWGSHGRPKQQAFLKCSAIWKIIPMTRYHLMSDFVASSAGLAHAEREALFTTVRLMRWTDLAHIPIIDEALRTFDLLKVCPILQSEIAAYVAGIKQMYEMMPWMMNADKTHALNEKGEKIKDITTLPYLKALHGDRKTIAQRNTMESLLAVCHSFLLAQRPTLNAYTAPKSRNNVILAVQTWHDQMQELINRA